MRFVKLCSNEVSILKQAAIQAVQAMNGIIVQTAGADMQTNKPNITEWTARPPFQIDEEEVYDEDDKNQGAYLDRL